MVGYNSVHYCYPLLEEDLCCNPGPRTEKGQNPLSSNGPHFDLSTFDLLDSEMASKWQLLLLLLLFFYVISSWKLCGSNRSSRIWRMLYHERLICYYQFQISNFNFLTLIMWVNCKSLTYAILNCWKRFCVVFISKKFLILY